MENKIKRSLHNYTFNNNVLNQMVEYLKNGKIPEELNKRQKTRFIDRYKSFKYDDGNIIFQNDIMTLTVVPNDKVDDYKVSIS